MRHFSSRPVRPQEGDSPLIVHYFSQSKVRSPLQSGPIGSFFPTSITALEDRAYVVDSIRRTIRTANRLGMWLQGQGVLLQDADQAHGDQYVASQGRRHDKRRMIGHLPQLARHIRTVTKVLWQQGVVGGSVAGTGVDRWADRFSTH